MSQEIIVAVFLVVAVVAANLPWVTERIFMVYPTAGGAKGVRWRLFEWLVLFAFIVLVGVGLERQLTGEVHAQDWEFYVVMLCLFIVFALPGFIYQYDLKKHLSRR